MTTTSPEDLSTLREQFEADHISALVYKVFSSDEGQQLFRTLEDMWFKQPMKSRLQDPKPGLTEGELAYSLGQQDAYNRIRLAYEQYGYMSKTLADAGVTV